MADLAALPFRTPRVDQRVRRIAMLAASLVVAALAGVAIGRLHAADPAGLEGSLVLLLRFMAMLKAAAVLGGTALVVWRLGGSLGEIAFMTYAGPLVLMAVAPGLIWTLGLVAVGAVLFHAGLLTFLTAVVCDDGIATTLKPRRSRG